MLSCCKSTRFKVATVHRLYLLLKLFGVRSPRIIRRNGITYEVDLAEGIDLSLFLFGGFQKHITGSGRYTLPADAVIFDIGANIGTVSLSFAKALPAAKIYAFEPTEYAHAKLLRNMELNEGLRERISPIKAFIGAGGGEQAPGRIFASWRVDTLAGERHPVHLGIARESVAPQITLGDFVERQGINRLDFIKIDTDGNELKVFTGARNVIARFRPVIVFEVSTYLLREQNQSFADFEKLLHPLGYRLQDLLTGAAVEAGNLDRVVPKSGSADILALPPQATAG